eukprot:4685453-Ditylum_brightwellii.AAC.1
MPNKKKSLGRGAAYTTAKNFFGYKCGYRSSHFRDRMKKAAWDAHRTLWGQELDCGIIEALFY